MDDLKATLRIVGLVLHVLAAAVLVLLFLKTGGMTVFCVVAGALIGCASVPVRPGRPITVYTAFGLLMGYAFGRLGNQPGQFSIAAVPAGSGRRRCLAAGAAALARRPVYRDHGAVPARARGRAIPSR